MTDSYAEAGVSIESADRAVELMKVWVDRARRPEMIGGIGGFAGLFDASALKDLDHPVLATHAFISSTARSPASMSTPAAA